MCWRYECKHCGTSGPQHFEFNRIEQLAERVLFLKGEVRMEAPSYWSSGAEARPV
jgi:hypothetical protein